MIHKFLTALEPYINFLLVMTIRNRNGDEHFKRWRLLWLPLFGTVYLHKISRSDADPDPHNHPWNFISLILSGQYVEKLVHSFYYSNWVFINAIRTDCQLPPLPLRSVYNTCKPGSLVRRRAHDFHKIAVEQGPVWTLVWVGSRTNPDWGYATPSGFLQSEDYRKSRHA